MSYFSHLGVEYKIKKTRWHVVDPMAEFLISEGVYNYVSNNPILSNDPTGMIGKNINDNLASTFIGPDGTIIEHRDDGDDNVYLVNDPSNWNGSKDDLPVVGKENPNVDYREGEKYKYYHPNDYDPSSLLNYLNSISAVSISKIAANKANNMLDNMSANFVPLFDASGKEVIGLVPKGKGAFAYKFVRFVKGAFEFIGPAGDVVLTVYNTNQWVQVNMLIIQLGQLLAFMSLSHMAGLLD
ncbi:hypothetical protein QQ020_14835 [Fulvivirgaceae bacterium BMA12]|uniref:RHS repeat-associated core domain-containing protein n=1 Tax=Agaribacillus aureus TaxID=3051825 RepID=A0ABT8L6G2_9BACT|nr:hypothetical protein [Fulvivirgaceae bacterium BMA12]